MIEVSKYFNIFQKYNKIFTNCLRLLSAFHELLLQSFHLFSFSSYGHPSGSILKPSGQTEKANHLCREKNAGKVQIKSEYPTEHKYPEEE